MSDSENILSQQQLDVLGSGSLATLQETTEDWTMKYFEGLDDVGYQTKLKAGAKEFQRKFNLAVLELRDYAFQSAQDEIAILQELVEIIKLEKAKEEELLTEKQLAAEKMMEAVKARLLSR